MDSQQGNSYLLAKLKANWSRFVPRSEILKKKKARKVTAEQRGKRYFVELREPTVGLL